MHYANEAFWQYCVLKYKYFFGQGKSVAEYGSYNINGSIRPILSSTTYIGIDWRPGPSVDVVSLAHEFKSDIRFDAVVSASMLEHDPYWDKSLESMNANLKETGILILSWGAARNGEHCLAEAPDGKFHALKAGLVIEKLEALGFKVFEFWYEKNLEVITKIKGGDGEACLVAFKSGSLPDTFGAGHIDELFEEDRVSRDTDQLLLSSASEEEIEKELVRRKHNKALSSIPRTLTEPLWGSVKEMVSMALIGRALGQTTDTYFGNKLTEEVIRAIYGQPGLNWYLDLGKQK